MPSTLIGLLVAVYALIPGYCYYAVRRRTFPTRPVSTVVEGANLLVVAVVANTASLALYGVLQWVPWFGDHSPSIVEILRDTRGYLLESNARVAYVGVWAMGVLTASSVLAVAFAHRVWPIGQLAARFAPALSDESEDTEYKRSVFDICSEHARKADWAEFVPAMRTMVVRFEVVDEVEWQARLNGMLFATST